MDTGHTLDSAGTRADTPALSTEDYWARVQSLRADLERLTARPPPVGEAP